MLLKFTDRETELRLLEEKYSSNRSEFIVIYGRRRVGKTELIKQFIKNKPHFYFLAKKKNLVEELDRFRLKFSKEHNIFIDTVKDWDDLFEKILKNYDQKPVIIMDEFPYWVEKDDSILSDFQHLWDETIKDKNCFIILCGSYVSVMENDVLGYTSPLYGRRTGQIELNKLEFRDFCNFFPKWSTEEKIKAYGALDGIPFYIKEFEQNKNFFENVQNTFWKSGSVLNKEVEFLLSQELREVEVYLSILRSIFEGATKLNEIATKSNVHITNINKYLKVLLSLRFIKKEIPVLATKPKGKNYTYKLADMFLSFWLSYVYPNKDSIEIGELDHIKENFEHDYNLELGFIFEEVSKQTLRYMDLPFSPAKIGRWWYQDTEIDIICLDKKEENAFFIECKWSELNELNLLNIIEQLKEKSKFVKCKSKSNYFGVIAKKIQGKERLRKKGYFVWDLEDVDEALKA